MRSSNVSYMPRIDHLRLLAALLVFGFHFFHHNHGGWKARPDLPWLAPIVEGHTGVSLFFVLSGFIFMTIALRGGEIDYRRFMRNRFLRIAPLYLLVFFVAISIGRDRFVPADVLYLAFSNLGLAPTSWHFVTGPAWSISVEFTFYLVFPFLARFTREQGVVYLFKLLAMLLVIKVAAFLVSERSTHMFYSTLIGRFDQFLWGMLAAIVYERRREWLERHGTALFAASIALVWAGLAAQGAWASFFAPEPRQAAWIGWSSLEGVLWAAFIVAYLAAPFRLPPRVDRALARGGAWSFSFYLWHALVIFVVNRLFAHALPAGPAALVPMAIVALAATFAFAWLSYTAIERPFLQLRGSYLRSTRDAAPAGG